MSVLCRGADGDGRNGQAIVEFALVLPIFVLLVFGAIEFGRAYYDLHLLTNAAREGARYGIVNEGDATGVQNAVSNLTAGMNISFPPSTVTFNSDTIVVYLEFDFEAASPVLGILTGTNTWTLSSTATMEGEW